MYQTKHIPIRSCIGCGLKRPQKDFVKIVRTKHNSISIKLNNTSDKSEGRSIYMCRSFDCWTEAKKKGKIDRNIKANLSEKDILIISEYMAEYR